jgi:calcium-dependent protein kinase
VPLSWKKGGISICSKSEEFLKKSLTIEETERISWEKIFEMFEVSPANAENKLAFY